MHNQTADRSALPYGIRDIDPAAARTIPREGPFRCVIKGCRYLLRPPTREPGDGQLCPIHEIYNHRSGTYRYAHPRRNLIADPDFFTRYLIGHTAKFESHRFGQENSEDAVTWNVFRSFQNAGLLHIIVNLATGQHIQREPQLFLWGIRIEPDRVAPEAADLLVAARARFEMKLPVARPRTEPDIMLFQPGRYLVLIEAKLTSPNGIYIRGPRRKACDLTMDELLGVYHDPMLQLLDYPHACAQDRIAYQLYRNTVFSEWMAGLDGPSTKAYHANLVCDGCEEDTAEEFHQLFTPKFKDRFRRFTWEQIYAAAIPHEPRLGRFCRYMENKTTSLTKAFKTTIPSAQPNACVVPGR